MLQASKTKRGMDLAYRNRTIAPRTSELDKITPCHSSLAVRIFGTRIRLFSLVQSQDSALSTSFVRASAFRHSEIDIDAKPDLNATAFPTDRIPCPKHCRGGCTLCPSAKASPLVAQAIVGCARVRGIVMPEKAAVDFVNFAVVFRSTTASLIS